MSSSDEEIQSLGGVKVKDKIRYKDREEWNDIKPISQNPVNIDNIVSIHYSNTFKDVYDYFRGILKVNEKSLRALELTNDALELNPANYTVWQYRREIIEALGLDLDEELLYLREVIENNPKNYQVWHHRQVIVQWKNDPSKELQLTETILERDPKNYHAWQHRQWVIKTFGLFDKELDYVEYLIDGDVRNNSAWNQRYFVVSNTGGFTEETVRREVDYAAAKIKQTQDNESAWNYLRGVLIFHARGLSAVADFCQTLYEDGSRCPHLCALIVDICQEVVAKEGGNSVYNSDRALELCQDLETKYDVIRSRYWKYIGNKFTSHRNETPPPADA